MTSWLPSPATLILYLTLGTVALGFVLTCIMAMMRGWLKLFGLTRWALSWGWRWLTGTAPSSHGTSHVADASEISDAGLFTPGGITLGTWQGRTLYAPTGGHVSITAPARSWKSTSFLAPNIVRYAGSILVNDPRAELWKMCHVSREAAGPTYRFNPMGKESCGINIMDAMRWDQDDVFSDLQRLSHNLMSPDDGEWDDFRVQARALLRPILMHVHTLGQGSLPGVYRWLANPATTIKDQAAEMLASPLPDVQAGGRRLKDLLTSERTASIVWNHLTSTVDLYGNPIVAANTDHSDLDLRHLQHGSQPMSIFLTTPFADVSTCRPLFGALTEQLCALFSAQQDTPRQPVALFLDETGNLGRLSELERGQSYLQGCGVQIIQTWQNVLQVRQVYGPDSPFMASVATKVYYTPSDQETAEHISEQLGETTTRLRPETQTVDYWGFLQRTSYGTTEHARRLRTADEVRRLPNTAAVIIHTGLAPVLATKLGSAAPEIIDLARPMVKRLALAACLVMGLASIASLGAWALWPTSTPAPSLSLPGQVSPSEPGARGAQAPRVNGEPTPSGLSVLEQFAYGRPEPKRWQLLHEVTPPPWGKEPWSQPETFHGHFTTEQECHAALARKLASLHQIIAQQAPGKVYMQRLDNGFTQTLGTKTRKETWRCAYDTSEQPS